MMAIGVLDFGGPDALQVVQLPDPQAGPGEVRIRVHAAAVNPTDAGLRGGMRYRSSEQVSGPYVPGMDAAGTLDQIGDGVRTDLRVGEHVMAIVLPSETHGAYAEYVVVPAESVARVPAGASDAEAASLPMNGLTTRAALDSLELHPGQHLAVTGAAGAVGGYAIQLAKADGLHVIADAAPKDEQLVRELGADVVLPRGEDFPRHVREAYPDGVDGAVDSALLNDKLVPAVRDGGVIVTLRGYDGDAERGVSFRPVLVGAHARETDKLDGLRRQVEAGQLSLRVARTFPAAQAPDAHRALEAGGVRGRLILEF